LADFPKRIIIEVYNEAFFRQLAIAYQLYRTLGVSVFSFQRCPDFDAPISILPMRTPSRFQHLKLEKPKAGNGRGIPETAPKQR